MTITYCDLCNKKVSRGNMKKIVFFEKDISKIDTKIDCCRFCYEDVI